MEIYSRDQFVVQQKYVSTTDPISGTFTISCAASPPLLTASAGVLLDPGGTGNYPASLTCTQAISTPGNPVSVGYELTFTQFDTEANGDSVIIWDVYGTRLAFSGSALPPVLLVPGYRVAITFRADNDGNVGAGFALSWRRVTTAPSPIGAGDGFFGKSLRFDLTKGSLVSGFSGVGAMQQMGKYATALGSRNTVGGDFSGSWGYVNTVSGDYSSAFGGSNGVGGNYSNAMGFNNQVSWDHSNALGRSNTVSGYNATAVGSFNAASGNNSTAIGTLVSTAGYEGAMLLGDNSTFLTFTSTLATATNQLTARFAGGYRLFSNSTLTTGVSLAAGGTSWATISDSTRKERFLAVDGPTLLQKISGMKLTTWNYKGQRDRRHYGPMAQEFFSLFGKDALGEIGCDTLITTQDIEGLTLSAVQALVKENERLRVETQSFASQLAEQKTETQRARDEAQRARAETQRVASLQAEMNNRLHLLERAILTRRERVTMRKTKP